MVCELAAEVQQQQSRMYITFVVFLVSDFSGHWNRIGHVHIPSECF